MNFSYSSLELLNACPRKFELEKLLVPEDIQEQSIDLIAGGACGLGIGKILQGLSWEKVVWETYLRWTFPGPGQTFPISMATKKKSFPFVLAHLEKFKRALDTKEILGGWKLWTLPSGKPAVEVGIKIKFPGGFFWRGFIDAILWCPETGEFTALEVKTSGFTNAPTALFQNSIQGRSYALVVDYITKRKNAEQIYLVLEFPQFGQQVMSFMLSAQQKVSWLSSFALATKELELYKKYKHFPMRGQNCYSYFRPCKYLGMCELPRESFGKEWLEQKEEPDEHFDFVTTMEELLKPQ